jgi:signal transduction histidine kinase
MQAMPDGGELRVTVASGQMPQEGALAGRNDAEGRGGSSDPGLRIGRFCVADTGHGIPPEIQDRILEPFFTTKTEGSGLGLSTVHRIVESHGGDLRVESRDGRGTTFCVELPAAEVSR